MLFQLGDLGHGGNHGGSVWFSGNQYRITGIKGHLKGVLGGMVGVLRMLSLSG